MLQFTFCSSNVQCVCAISSLGTGAGTYDASFLCDDAALLGEVKGNVRTSGVSSSLTESSRYDCGVVDAFHTIWAASSCLSFTYRYADHKTRRASAVSLDWESHVSLLRSQDWMAFM